jgi:hypothetical protein
VMSSGQTVERSTFHHQDMASTKTHESHLQAGGSKEEVVDDDAPMTSKDDERLDEVEALRRRVKELESEVKLLKQGYVPNHAMKSAVLEVRSLLKKEIQVQADLAKSRAASANNALVASNSNEESCDDAALQRHVKSQLHAPTVDKERVGQLMRRMSSAFKKMPEEDHDSDGTQQEICSAEFMKRLEEKKSKLSNRSFSETT